MHPYLINWEKIDSNQRDVRHKDYIHINSWLNIENWTRKNFNPVSYRVFSIFKTKKEKKERNSASNNINVHLCIAVLLK